MNARFEAISRLIKEAAENNATTKEVIVENIKESIQQIYNRRYDQDGVISVVYDEDAKLFQVINETMYVVEGETEYPVMEISLEEARKINPDVQVDDQVAAEIDIEKFSEISRNVSQLFTQKTKEQRKALIFNKYKDREGEMIDVLYSRSDDKYHIFTLVEDSKTEAHMPVNFSNKGDQSYYEGEAVQVYVEEVKEDKFAQIIVSKISPEIVKRVIENEVPEVMSGDVEIMAIAREFGFRTKVAVKSNNPNVEPVGAIIGSRGSRIKNIIAKLDGNEKIDVIQWSDDINVFVANALSPAKIISVVDKRDEEGNILENQKIAIAPKKQETLAIGKRGANARLAVKLTGHSIDIKNHEAVTEMGIDFEFNVGYTREDLERIENGQQVQKLGLRKPVVNHIKSYDTQEDDMDIERFNEQLMAQETDSEMVVPMSEEQDNNEPQVETEEEATTEDSYDIQDFDIDLSDDELGALNVDYGDEDFSDYYDDEE